jgi:hypothetical protein
VSTGIFCRTGDGGEAFIHTGTNALAMVEIAVLGAGKALVLIL